MTARFPANPALAHRVAFLKPHKHMSRRLRLFLFGLCSFVALGLRAQEPPLLAKALQRWIAGQGDLAFTQRTRIFLSDGGVKEERVERYDPSLPDSRRWRLIEVNGLTATTEQRERWEARKNGRPRIALRPS